MKAATALAVLLGGHLLLGIARLPGRVWQRRVAEVRAYREAGAARFLLERAKLDGADEIEWLLANVPADHVVLWRWPADGALEFVAALLAPRLVVDERAVPDDATTFAGRPIATSANGRIVVQGTEHGGLRIHGR
ncbi:MAG TPA: hypothetical protein ENI87_08270 [bacterium]|nr:hypothetical protein [bacterium]